MAKPILMPQVGQDIETARILEWYVEEGDYVKNGDLVAAIESDKATFELESFEEGTVSQILYRAGEEARVLEPIAFIGEQEDKPEKIPAASKPEELKKEKSKTLPPPVIKEQRLKLFISPAARRAAKIHDINPETVKGSGPNGRIIKRDILNVSSGIAAGLSENSSGEEEIFFSSVRQKIAVRMAASKQTIPHIYLSCEVNMNSCLDWRINILTTTGQKISVNDLLLAAAAMTLKQYPNLNAHVFSDRIKRQARINIGIAVGTDKGLLVPVLEDVDKKSLAEISTLSKQIITKARSGRIKATVAASFTISNLGMYGITHFLPIINPPECAILGVGMIEKKLIPFEQDSIKICSMMNLSLVCDHRAVDGIYGAQFLAQLKKILEEVLFTRDNSER